MVHLYIIMARLTAVILFVFGLKHFSQEIERITGERFRKSFSRATRMPVIGVALGALVTAVIQSSSVTTGLANIHLVFNAGTTLIFVLFIKPFTRLVGALLGESEMDFQRIPVPVFDAEKTPQVLKKE